MSEYIGLKDRLYDRLFRAVNIAPLLTFRILFGALMMVGALRFMYYGWVERLYVEPKIFFKFYGFAWVENLDASGMYFLYSLIALSAGLIMLGLFYRVATVLFFLSFTYVELVDATNYLNHYYLVCLLAFLLIFLPANRAFSLDAWLWPKLRSTTVPAWTILILIFQLSVVYTFAGLAKLSPDWLFRAMPMAVWLPERTHLPLLGYFFQFKWTAFAFSWIGAAYDLTIAYFLLNRRSRPWAYLLVIIFHVLTKILFNIGLFPFIMIFSTLIFFSGDFHEKLLGYIGYRKGTEEAYQYKKKTYRFLRPLLMVFVLLQLLLPFRYLLYPGHLLWKEEGYRFSWRVMLVEKNGQATFYIKDSKTDRKTEIVNGEYLTRFQEKQMCIQPDFILQFAHFLKKEYETKHGFIDPIITVDAHVALNGRTSQQFIDPSINLAAIQDDLLPKSWILSFRE